MRGGKQVVSLTDGCEFGATVHEIGHSLGLWHEQSREDRNAHVRVQTENIDPDELDNFDQHITDGDDVGAYDYASIMHYSRKAFSKNGEGHHRAAGRPEHRPARRPLGRRRAAIRSIYPDLERPLLFPHRRRRRPGHAGGARGARRARRARPHQPRRHRAGRASDAQPARAARRRAPCSPTPPPTRASRTRAATTTPRCSPPTWPPAPAASCTWAARRCRSAPACTRSCTTSSSATTATASGWPATAASTARNRPRSASVSPRWPAACARTRANAIAQHPQCEGRIVASLQGAWHRRAAVGRGLALRGQRRRRRRGLDPTQPERFVHRVERGRWRSSDEVLTLSLPRGGTTPHAARATPRPRW